VVWIVINDDVIAVPRPVGASIVIIRSRLKEESADVEPIAVSSMQPPDVTGSDGPGEMSVLPGMIEVIVSIAPAGFVSHPAIVLSVNVGRRRMPGLVLVCPSLLGMLGLMLRWLWCWSSYRSGAALRNVPAAYSLFVYCMLLRCLMRLTVLLTASFLCQCCAGENRYDDYNQKA
jgi:hypothetical protein